MKRDLYDTLGVPRTSSREDIRKAYRKKAAKLHPDNPETGDEAEFKNLSLAHEVLSHDDKRRIYDDTGAIPGAGGEDREKLEALALIFNLAAQGIADEPRGDVVQFIRLAIGNSQREARGRLEDIDVATATITKSWKGAEMVKKTVLRGLEDTAAELRKRQKIYDVATTLMADASFDWEDAQPWDGIGTMRNRFKRLR